MFQRTPKTQHTSTTKTAQIVLFIERVRLLLDCILLEGCGGTTLLTLHKLF